MGAKPDKRKTKRKQEESARELNSEELEKWSLLVEEWEKPVFYFVRRRVKDLHSAEDVVQKIFHKALQCRDQFDPAVSGSGWILSIAKSVVIDHHRHSKAAKRDEPPVPTKLVDGKLVDFSDERVAPEKSPIERAVEAEQKTELIKAIDCLDAKNKKLATLYYLDELSVEEVATELGMSSIAVKSALQRLRTKLNNMLSHMADEFPNIEKKWSEQ